MVAEMVYGLINDEFDCYNLKGAVRAMTSAFFYNKNNVNFITCFGIHVQDGLIWLHFIGGNHISCIWPGMADLLLWSYYWF